MAQDLKLFVDGDNGRCVLGFTSSIPATFPSFKSGDWVPVSVRILTASNEGVPYKEQDLTNRTIRLAIGNPAGRPTSGTFTLTFGGDTTAPLPFNATAEQVAAELNALASITTAGGVSVTSPGAGAYKVIFDDAGARGAITADTAPLYPTTGAFISEAQAGAGDVREVVLIRLEVQPAAYVQLDDELPGAAATVTVTRAGSEGVGTIQTLDLSEPEPYGGDYALTVNGYPTGAITYNALASDVQAAIQATHSTLTDKVTVTGTFPRYTVSFDHTLGSIDEMEVNVAALIVPKGRQGVLNLNTTGITELLNGAATATAKLEIEVRDTLNSSSWTPIQQDVTVVEDVIPSEPASQTEMPAFVTLEDVDAALDGAAIRYDGAQSLTNPQKSQARTNIGFLAGMQDHLQGAISTVPTGSDPIASNEHVLMQLPAGGLYRTTFGFIASSATADCLKTSGNQTAAGTKTFSSPIVSTGTPSGDNHVPNQGQVRGIMFGGFTPMRKVTGTHNNLTGSVLTFDLSAPSPNWNGSPGAEDYWRTLELIISAQHTGSSTGQFILYRAMIFFREYEGTWNLIGQQVIVNSNNANSALGAWQVGPYTPNPGSPSGTIALTNVTPGSEHVCMLQYAYSYY